uniref:Uncharacterized protein n=1 Tax=Xiphophorus maculatus TaxID=8083 RepID=A0A3B5RF83_XIPMA
MADLLKFKQRVEELKSEYYNRNRFVNRKEETQAAIRIQSWFRFCRSCMLLVFDINTTKLS